MVLEGAWGAAIGWPLGERCGADAHKAADSDEASVLGAQWRAE